MEERYEATCSDCGETFIEVYPDGIFGGESYHDADNTKDCICESDTELGKQL